MDGEVSRLAQSVRNLLIEPDWVGYALDDAQDWLRVVDKEEWEQFIDLWYDLEEFGESLQTLAGMGASGYGVKSIFDRLREHEDWLMARDRAGTYVEAWRTAMSEYDRAWIDYVSKVRLKVDPLYRYQYGMVTR